ncbi:MAG TPA: PGPGW domain-containing protein [Candidatus Paceibacterota bacterium]
MKKKLVKFLSENPKLKKIVGIILILVGLFALVTPLTPGSWLVFIGMEFLGLRFLLWDKIRKRFWKSSEFDNQS